MDQLGNILIFMLLLFLLEIRRKYGNFVITSNGILSLIFLTNNYKFLRV
jgi:hypothetical protein